ncbi:MucBP domain-containing protein [Streptococcus sp. 27098_8_22]|uniref:MucBP domain-containing protein n=1 Tax=Streptococcus sp. 27098_8_22 TaxID=3003665 RepID=UPI00352C791B
MKEQNKNTVKGHGFFRKSSAYGLVSGLALGAVLIMGAGAVSADEVATGDGAAPSAQFASDEKQDQSVVVDKVLTEAVEKAKEAGLTVEKEPTKNIGTATTDEQAKELEKTAEKEVTAQKAEIEKKTNEYKTQYSKAEASRKDFVKDLANNPLLYSSASAQLNDAGDVDFNNGKASYGQFSSSKGSVSFLNTENNIDLSDKKQLDGVVTSSVGSQKEINTYYSKGDMFSANTSIADKKNSKVVPIEIAQGETITYKVNYAPDSLLAQLGVAYVEKKIRLNESPLKSGKVVLLADRYGSGKGNFVLGGLGKFDDVIKTGDWSYDFTKTYFGKDGKILDSKELTSKVFNKFAFGGKEILKASDIQVTVAPKDKNEEIFNGDDAKLTQVKSLRATYGGESFDKYTRVETVVDNSNKQINPVAHEMIFGSQKLRPFDVSHLEIPSKPNMKYHLVSYKKVTKKNDVPTKPVEKYGSVTVEHVTDKGEVLKSTEDVVKKGKVGSDYSTEQGKFDKVEKIHENGKVIERTTTYKLVAVPGNAKGKVVEGNTHVKYVYTKTVTDKDVTPKPVEPSKPTEPAKPAEPVKPTEPVKPVESPKPTELVKPTEPAKQEPSGQLKELPNTGTAASMLSFIGIVSGLLGLTGLKRKKD